MIDQYAVLAHYYDALVSTRNTDAVRGDKKFYVEEAIASGGPVLEFGAGTLRMSLAIGKVGIRVIAVDNSPAMIEIAVKKRARHAQEIRKLIEITQGDMRNFSVFEKVPLALIPFRAFQNLLTPNDQRRCLENAFRNLLPSGKLRLSILPEASTTASLNKNSLLFSKVVGKTTASIPEIPSEILIKAISLALFLVITFFT